MLRLRVKEVAGEKGFSMMKLSRASDVTFNTIKRLYRNPYGGANINTLDKIARALGVPLSELTEEVPDEK